MWGLSNEFMAWATGVVLGSFVLLILFALLKKPRQYDPQMGQAIGCLMIVWLVLGLLGTLLAVSIIWEIVWLLKTLFVVAVFPLVWVLLGLVYNLVLYVTERLRGRD